MSEFLEEPSHCPPINHALMDRYFRAFKAQVEKMDGRPLRSFSTSDYIVKEEGYKAPVYFEARMRLALDKWTQKKIGSGTILKAVIAAIEQKKNNLLMKGDEHGPGSKDHAVLYHALEDSQKRSHYEELFFHFYKDPSSSDRDFFEKLLEDKEARTYPLIAYLFFIKYIVFWHL